ncbi:MAG: 50S ribosomal protein L9 [Flavobacteriales bacterium]|jgi:large subunit ribosomal protein L9|nr:50S ribosomal protein L9 [Flavobacteriales bacterium]
MEILLKKNFESLGEKNDIVTVKNGYARNYLFPNGIAILATDSVKKMQAETLKQRAHKEVKLKDEAEKLSKLIKKASIVVAAKVGENGKIFGSVSSIQLVDSLKALGHDIDRKSIKLSNDNIKSIGKYTADIKLHKEVSVNVEFEVAEG